MTQLRIRCAALHVVGIGALLAAACSSSPSSGGGSGGTQGTGGATTSGNGGAAAGVGGDTGNGGSATGGAPGAGGTTGSTGGAPGAGGQASGGTTGGTGGAVACAPPTVTLPAGADSVFGTMVQFNDNGAWSWYQDERAIVDTKANKLIVGSVASGGTRNGNIEAAVYNIATNTT